MTQEEKDDIIEALTITLNCIVEGESGTFSVNNQNFTLNAEDNDPVGGEPDEEGEIPPPPGEFDTGEVEIDD